MPRPLALLPLLVVVPLAIAEPRFTARDAIHAEWARQLPALDDKQRAALPETDRARDLLSRQRIGAPGAPPLLSFELDKPYVPTWQLLANAAKSPQERFTALYFLNRLNSRRALSALAGLTADDAKRWPRFLHLDNQIVTARLRGEEPSPQLEEFLAALPIDRVRAQAARLRLVLEGRERDLYPPLEPTPGAVLAMMEAWNKAPWELRSREHLLKLIDLQLAYIDARRRAHPLMWRRLGLATPQSDRAPLLTRLMLVRLLEGLPDSAPCSAISMVVSLVEFPQTPPDVRRAAYAVLSRTRSGCQHPAVVVPTDRTLFSVALPAMRAVRSPDADKLRDLMLAGDDPIARAAAIDDLKEPPPDLIQLRKRVFADGEIDSLQALIAAFDRWKLAPAQRSAVLRPFLTHPTWIARYEAWKVLSAIQSTTPWPTAPPPTEVEKSILVEAERLAESGKPVRMRITFEGNRALVLRLDPVNAPINVANLKLLAQRHFFDGRRVPRIVPDFVVQMGSPLDTMDGGPGYSVRCEDSLDWYGPGSVGMALSGKDTGGSQFFITLNAAPHLTGRYTRVGAVEDPGRALPLLDALELGAKIEKIEVIE